MRSRLRPSPALLVAMAALFFTAGGSAFALSAKAPPPQPRCAQGAVRGIAEVTGSPKQGIPNVPDTYTADPSVFGRKWSCTGGAIQVRRLDVGNFDIRFLNNAATSALISGGGNNGAGADIHRMPDGSFHITLGTPDQAVDVQFTVVVF